MAWTANRDKYIADILRGIGAPTTHANKQALLAWAQAEGGSAGFNPFNTTMPGGSAYNSNGGHPVQSYGNYNTGLHATVATLKNGLYGNILQALRGGHNAMAVGQAIENSPWGTHGLVIDVLKGWGVHGGPAPQAGNPNAVPVRQANGRTADKSGLMQMLMAQNESYALQGKTLDPTYAKSIMQNGLTPQDQAAAGNVAPPKGGAVKAGGGVIGSIISEAKQHLGTPYLWGGTTPKGFDCSGLVQYAYAKAGISIPRTTYEQIKQGKKVGLNNLRAGDLVFTGSPSSPHHVVMYIGNGKVIEAPHTGDHVKIAPLSWFTADFAGARRYVH